MRPTLKRWVTDASGATAIEYALICGLIFVVIVGSLGLIASNTGNRYNLIGSSVANAMN